MRPLGVVTAPAAAGAGAAFCAGASVGMEARSAPATARQVRRMDNEIVMVVVAEAVSSVVSCKYMALRFDQAAMIVRAPARGDTEWYLPWPACVRGRRLVEPLRGGPKRGDPVVAQAGRYHPVSPCLPAYGSSPLRPVHMSDICGTAH